MARILSTLVCGIVLICGATPVANARPYVGDAADVGGYRLVLKNVKTTTQGPESVLCLPDPKTQSGR